VLGEQYLDTRWFGVVVTLIMVAFVLLNIKRAHGKKGELFIRRIPGLNAIDEAVGRATEMGTPVLMVPGLGDLNAISVQALTIFTHVTRIAARFANPIRLCCYNPAVYTVAQEMIRDVYQQEGIPEKYDPDSVMFLIDRQFAFAAAVSGIIHRERTSAAFFLGEFFAESMIFAETANAIGAIQVAASTEKTQTPFFIAACDYVLIGDEFYAASAYLSRAPVLVGSLVGQDWCKMLIGAFVLIGFPLNSIQMAQTVEFALAPDGTQIQAEPHKRLKSETSLYRLFNPIAPVKGSVVSREYESFQAYLAQRMGELATDQAPTPGSEEVIGEDKGQWHTYTLYEDELERNVEDLVVISESGSVRVIREFRSRLKQPAKEIVEGGAE